MYSPILPERPPKSNVYAAEAAATFPVVAARLTDNRALIGGAP